MVANTTPPRSTAAASAVPAQRDTPTVAKTLTLSPRSREAAIHLLRQLRESGAEEQLETWEVLVRALGQDRLSSRKLLP